MQNFSFKKHISTSALTLQRILIFFFITLFFSCSQVWADDTEKKRKEEKKRIEIDISKHQINIEQLDEGLTTQKESVKHAVLQEKGILSDIERIDLRLLKAAKKIAELKDRTEKQRLLIIEKESELKRLKENSERVQLHLQKRMGAYYKLGKIDLINITFSTQTLPELLKFHDSFQSVLKYDQRVISSYRGTIDDLERVTEALTLEHGLLEEFVNQAKEEEESFRKTKADQKFLLAKINSQKQLHEQTIDEIERAKDDLTASLLNLIEKDEYYSQGFFLNKGKHIPPVEGTIISTYNQDRVNKFGIERKTPGISFEAANGAKIRAIYDGTVLFSGYLRGYGNTVILDHGYQYFSIVSRIEQILAVKGDQLERNDIIGIMGETATLMDDGLYLEVRHKDKSLDPLLWLNRELLAFKEDLQL